MAMTAAFIGLPAGLGVVNMITQTVPTKIVTPQLKVESKYIQPPGVPTGGGALSSSSSAPGASSPFGMTTMDMAIIAGSICCSCIFCMVIVLLMSMK